ncbi:YaiI/YqxD family protein [Bacillus thermotolerans]|uniref:UPF0178 protein QY95_02530 n=1 Tax=Bacillus thermotolerans TaxID=1221996 RepID=A0A0F5I1F4_BACTR|nr:YaiI/YqxD family protein [Bacillus thermotolerans]KKB34205.1 hypothetical protein QY97_02606 [Bacillus thermotolerans]KKB39090.1 hypothetical protein QY95_02530 [Bacillus thermotolerans]
MPDIFVDADGCPVVSIIIDTAKQYGLKVYLICDTSHLIQREGAETITVSKGSDAADFVLVNRMQKGDIVVTQDYGLAAMVLAKQGYAIDQNGRFYTPENMDQLLGFRHISKKARQAGQRMKGPKKRQKESDMLFKERFIQLIEKVISEG